MNEFQPDLTEENSKEYKFVAIWNSEVYAKELENYLPSLYYLVSSKGYPEKENALKPVLAV